MICHERHRLLDFHTESKLQKQLVIYDHKHRELVARTAGRLPSPARRVTHLFSNTFSMLQSAESGRRRREEVSIRLPAPFTSRLVMLDACSDA